jgi:periplasmic glucans biosynthesis protein
MRAGALALAGMGGRFVAPSRAHAAASFDATATFGPTTVQALAEQLAAQPFVKPAIKLPQAFLQLGYDQFRDIRFRTDQAIWRGEKVDFELQLLPMGWLFEVPVEIWLVDNGDARRLLADSNLFSLGPLVGDVGAGAPYGFSGFRVHGPINRPD